MQTSLSPFLPLSLSPLTRSPQASLIYEGTAFNPPNSPPIHFGIEDITIETMPPPADNPFANDFLGVQTFLDLHSRNNFSQYCLSYRFTHRDFDDGVVGLAYIGPQPTSNAAGKTCVCVCVHECECDYVLCYM